MDESKPVSQYPGKRTAGDNVHSGIKVVLSAIPYVGGSAAELFSLVIASPLAARRDSWLASLGMKINELQNKVDAFSPEALSDNPQFISAILTALPIALRTHAREKLESLQNATLNTALNPEMDGTREFMFLHWIDEFTPYHLRILQILRNPRAEWEAAGGHLGTGSPLIRVFINEIVPELEQHEELTEQIVEDLKARGLLASHLRGAVVLNFRPGEGPLLSDLGERFLRFIDPPNIRLIKEGI